MTGLNQFSGKPVFLWSVIAVGTMLRFMSCLLDNPLNHLFSDPGRHWSNAVHFFNPDLMGGADPILYQVYLYLLHHMFGENSWPIGIVTGLLCAVMPWTFYRASRSFNMNRFQALVVWAIVCWIPSLWTIYSYFMMETLLLVLVGTALWMTGRSVRKKTSEAFLWTSFFWVLATLTKPSVAPLAAVCLFYAWWRAGRPLKTAFIAAGLAVLLVLPNIIRTWQVLGFPAPLGMSWITKIQHRSDAKHIEIFWDDRRWIFSSPSAYQQPLEPISPWVISRAYNDDKTIVRAKSANGVNDWRDAYESIPLDIKGFIKRYTENWAMLLFALSWPDAGHQNAIALVNYWHRWIWAPIVLFCVIGNMIISRKKPQKWFDPIPLFTMSLLLFLLFQPFVTMEGRYRKPLEPLLIMNMVWVAGLLIQRYYKNEASRRI